MHLISWDEILCCAAMKAKSRRNKIMHLTQRSKWLSEVISKFMKGYGLNSDLSGINWLASSFCTVYFIPHFNFWGVLWSHLFEAADLECSVECGKQCCSRSWGEVWAQKSREELEKRLGRVGLKEGASFTNKCQQPSSWVFQDEKEFSKERLEELEGNSRNKRHKCSRVQSVFLAQWVIVWWE